MPTMSLNMFHAVCMLWLLWYITIVKKIDNACHFIVIDKTFGREQIHILLAVTTL